MRTAAVSRRTARKLPCSPSTWSKRFFSHLTYYTSKRKMLVCDLQGELCEDPAPPTFWLTDPVIHYKSRAGRKHVYGRTDRGAKGVSHMNSSHVCNDVCRALGLPGSVSK